MKKNIRKRCLKNVSEMKTGSPKCLWTFPNLQVITTISGQPICLCIAIKPELTTSTFFGQILSNKVTSEQRPPAFQNECRLFSNLQVMIKSFCGQFICLLQSSPS
jgi:hypothetical protein